jgi:hypothetical protein
MVKIPNSVQTIPGRESTATQELVFIINSIPPLGYETFYVMNTGQLSVPPAPVDKMQITNGVNELKHLKQMRK